MPERGDLGELTFLVERYLPVGKVDGLARAVDRVASVCAGDPDVRYVQSTFVPGDETCFCVFQAASIEAVRAVNAAGDFPVDRISAAISLPLPRVATSQLDHESSSHNKESR